MPLLPVSDQEFPQLPNYFVLSPIAATLPLKYVIAIAIVPSLIFILGNVEHF